jgi:hypothetical protein
MPHENELLQFIKELTQEMRADITDIKVQIQSLSSLKKENDIAWKVIIALFAILAGVLGVKEFPKL